MIRAGLTRWLHAPRLTGRQALLFGVAALAVPTLIRLAVYGTVTGCEFTPYLPFVLVSAVLVRWWQAALVALGSVVILGGLFLGPSHDHVGAACFLSSAGMFLASSAAIIGTVLGIRRVLAAHLARSAVQDSGAGIIFSLEQEQVWATWHGDGPPLPLGSKDKVSEMMKDFLAQLELGERLNRRS